MAEKFDLMTRWASKHAQKSNCHIEDITMKVFENKGIKKVRFEISFGANEEGDDWNKVERRWSVYLPTPEDLAYLKNQKIEDVLYQRGYDGEKWGKPKIAKLALTGGEVYVLNGAKDEPGIEEGGDE